MTPLDPSSTSFVDKLEIFESKHRAFINLFVKPVGSLLIFLAIGYYTMWMSANYVKQEKFNLYVEKQDQVIQSNFEITRNQLQTIINQQITFTEQLKAYNMQMNGYQRSLDSVSERVTFLERTTFQNGDFQN